MNVSGMSLFCTPLFTSYSSSNLSHAFNVTFYLSLIILIFLQPPSDDSAARAAGGFSGSRRHVPWRTQTAALRPEGNSTPGYAPGSVQTVTVPRLPPETEPLSSRRTPCTSIPGANRNKGLIGAGNGGGSVGCGGQNSPGGGLGENLQKRTETEPAAIVRIENLIEERPNGSGQAGQPCCASSGAQDGVSLTQELSNYSSTPVR